MAVEHSTVRPAATPDGPRRRRAVLTVCTLAMGLGAAPTFLTGYLGPALRADLGLSGAQLGLLVGLFYGSTGVVSLVAARLIDRLGARRCVAGDQAVVAAALCLAAATSSTAALVAASVLAGSAYAFANAGTSVAVTSVSRRDQAGTAVALKTAGIPAAATVLALAGLPAAAVIGWQGVCLVLAGAAALNAVAAALVLPGAVRVLPGGPTRAADARLPRGFAWVVLAATCFVIGTNPLSSWLVLSLVDGGVARGTAGLVSAIGTGTGAVVLVLAARRGDRAGPQGRAATAAGVAALTLLGIAALWAGTHLSLVLVAAGAVLGLLTAMVGAGFAHAVTVDRAPHAVGRATALMSGGYYLGALVSPLTFGALADHTGAYDASWAVTATAMALCVASYLAVQRWVRPPAETPTPSLVPTPPRLVEDVGQA